ncbi:MAG: hypothetical protein JXJ20_13910 [Anaerolineae bacterium]|jgi:NAD(P)H-flavin reductase|nr:hypothetical protein [Anaerolineae bacterium]
MRETQAIIERVRRVSVHLQQLDLSIDPALIQLEPGQSLFARLLEDDSQHAYLRELWVPVAINKVHITVELPAGRNYAPGRVASLLTPVGRPIPVRPGLGTLLLIANDTAPTPFILLAQRLIAAGAAVTLVLSGRATDYPRELLPPEVEILHGDTWDWPDRVETINWADQVIALAPPYTQQDTYRDLYHTISQIRQQSVADGSIYGLYTQRLACGTGACQACQVACHGNNRLACVDGPAFDLKDIVFR